MKQQPSPTLPLAARGIARYFDKFCALQPAAPIPHAQQQNIFPIGHLSRVPHRQPRRAIDLLRHAGDDGNPGVLGPPRHRIEIILLKTGVRGDANDLDAAAQQSCNYFNVESQRKNSAPLR
jgi:hypothetical protein